MSRLCDTKLYFDLEIIAGAPTDRNGSFFFPFQKNHGGSE